MIVALIIVGGVGLVILALSGATNAAASATDNTVFPPPPVVPDVTDGEGNSIMFPTGRLVADQIRVLAANAGFVGADLDTAIAIALAESSGNPGAVGDLALTPGGSIGLWQINLKFHPEYTPAELTDPQTNANAAYAIYQQAGNSFKPWSTFKTGSYLAYMPPGSGTVGV